MKKPEYLNQNYVDNLFSCLDGFGFLSYSLDECKFIQKTLKEEFDIFLSISEAQRFWKWRSEQWDATFLTIKDKQEILEFFVKYIKDADIDPEQIEEVNKESEKHRIEYK